MNPQTSTVLRWPKRLFGLGAAAILILVAGCNEAGLMESSGADQGPSASKADKKVDLAVCDPSQSGFTAHSDNPYFPLQVGYLWTYEGEEDGELIHLEIEALDLTESVAGVITRVVEEREFADGIRHEISRNFFAQAPDGSVCYFGEIVDIYDEAGQQVVSHEGQWRADDAGNGPGVIMPANPRPGVKYQMEDAPGVAEDEGTVVGAGPVEVLGQTVKDAIRVREFNPLDRSKGYKVFAPGFGLVIDGPVTLVSFVK